MSNVIKNRYEFVAFLEVKNGNPNGDPDTGNMPRMDIETGKGRMTPECLNRYVRNYVSIVKEGEPGNDIYVAEKSVLNLQNKKAYDSLGLKSESKKLPKKEDDAKKVTDFMCQSFYDVRAFGAVMSTEVNCGSVKGPVRIYQAESVDPIFPQNITITRVAVTTEKERDEGKEHMMGNKYIVPYALYKITGSIFVHEARKTGFSEDDLNLLWEALENTFELNRSAARGIMSNRKLIIFKHSTALGDAPSHRLFEAVTAKRKDENVPARCYDDYEIKIEEDKIPKTIQLTVKDL